MVARGYGYFILLDFLTNTYDRKFANNDFFIRKASGLLHPRSVFALWRA